MVGVKSHVGWGQAGFGACIWQTAHQEDFPGSLCQAEKWAHNRPTGGRGFRAATAHFLWVP